MTRDDFVAAVKHQNVIAFLRLIRQGETNQTDDAYREMFGGGLFSAPPWQHPHRAVTVGHLTSTAAGAYQFLSGTWDGLVLQFHFEDFAPANQDLGAVALVAQRGALDDVIAGRITDAVQKCRKEWASLPGAGYGQPEQAVNVALATYTSYAGQLAA
jgi:muramidase (phage lysozyme)